MLSKTKKTISIVLSILVVFSVFVIVPFSASAITRSEVESKLNSLMNQYVGKTATSSQMYQGSQCKGFANWVFLQIFGVYIGPYPDSAKWRTNTSTADVLGELAPGSLNEASCKALLQKGAPGDFIQVQRSTARGSGPHSMILVSVNDSGIEVFDANSDGKNTIKRYSLTYSQFDVANKGMSLCRAKGYNPVPDNNPTSNLDSVSGGTGNIRVRGWTFDNDDLTQSLQIHVYIGGSSATAGAQCVPALANASRPDVDNVYHVGQFHGFDVTIPTNRTGSQAVYVYAINIGSGSNTEIGHGTVNITPDTTPPQISNIKITNIKNSGYTVSCNVSDNNSVDRVMFPSWHSSKTGNDAIWYKGTISNGVATCNIPISELGNKEGLYKTHIYAYDISGNQTSADAGTADIDKTPPVISDVEVIDIDGTGYTVKCKATDNKGINRVQFPSWTVKNDQDDIISDWATNSKASGKKDGDTYTYRVKYSEHNNESGKYATHIYAYDDCGNSARYALKDFGIVCGRNIGNNFVAKIDGLQSGKVLCNEDDKVYITADNEDDSVYWHFEKVTGTLYRISNNGHFLSYGDIVEERKAELYLEDVDAKNAKLWLIEKMGTNNYLIVPQDNVDYNLDVYGGYTEEGTKVQLHLYNGSDAQRFSFNKKRDDTNINPDNYIPSDTLIAHGSKYEVYDYNVTWMQAKAICEKKGGHLATVTNKSEDISIRDVAKKYLEYYWLGATDRDQEGKWTWVTGEKFDYTNWGEGQPDNANSSEHWLESDDKSWNDIRNSGEMHGLGFICEYDMCIDEMKPKETATLNGHTYKYFDMQTTWYEAEKICYNLGGHLVTITSEEEQNTVCNLLKNTKDGEIWLGATDSQNEGTWKWITKENFNYSNWNSGEPNNDNNEDYAQMYKRGKWNDIKEYSSSVVIGFVCEFEPESSLEYTTVKTSRYLDNDYEFIKGKVSWHEAKRICEEKGGHLVVINSLAENDYIINESKDLNLDHIWIGLTDEISKGVWRWITGEKVCFTDWDDKQPDNTYELEHYAEINYATSKKWNDLPNYTSYSSLGFVCEYENKTDAKNYTPKETCKLNNNTYEFYNDSVTWEKAKEIAKLKGGYLVSITSGIENTIVQSIAQELGILHIWLGGNDCENEGEWKWNDGSEFSYSNWQDNEPNNYDGNENYIEMNTSTGRWNDIDENDRLAKTNVGFVIKYYDNIENTESVSHGETESVEQTTSGEDITVETTEFIATSESAATEPVENTTSPETVFIEPTEPTTGEITTSTSNVTESNYETTETKVVSGTTGNCTWTLDLETGVFSIENGSEMEDYTSQSHAPWYKYIDKIKSVTINSELKNIGNYAFYGCKKLLSVDFNKELVTIGRNAFCNCSQLRAVNIPQGVKSIGLSAFYSCEKLHDLYLPDSLEVLTGNSFAFCKSIETLNIPNGLKTITSSSFWQCVSLTEVNISDSIKTIEDSAFMYCKSLKSITIPKNVETIGDYAFGYYYESGYKVYEGFVVKGYSGTISENYAKANHMNFESLDVIETTGPETDVTTVEETEPSTDEPTEATESTTETVTQPLTDAPEPTTKATETTIPVVDPTEPVTNKPTEASTTEPTTSITTDAPETDPTVTTAPVEIRTFNFLPDTEQAKSADSFKLVIQDTKNNLHTYNFLTTENLIDGAVVQTVNVPLNYDIAQVQYQMYQGETWIGQIVKSAAEITAIGENVVRADGTVIDPNEPTETTSESETTDSSTTEATEPSTDKSTEETTQSISDKSTEPVTDKSFEPTTVKPTELIGTEPQHTTPKPTSPAVKPSSNQKDNPIKITVKAKTVKLKKLKKKAQKVKPLTIKSAKGKVSIKITGAKKAIKKYLKFNSKGTLTIKRWKKAKKGTYKIKVKITVKGDSKYKPKIIKKTVKITIN